jgi:hypothetical protein
MAKAKKTVNVRELVARANAALKATPDDWVGEREGISMFIQAILMDTDNYRGFGYLPSEFDEDGKLADWYDDSRRHYYYSEV